jgi:ATP-dependent 26S proteasome regulatory subunit
MGNAFGATHEVKKKLPPDLYGVGSSPNGYYLMPIEQEADDLIVWEGSPAKKVMDEIATFWEKENHFRKMGAVWKRGILLWGPPGCGKTSVIRSVQRWFFDKGGFGIIGNIDNMTGGLRMIRDIEPKRPILVIIEDIDAYCSFGGSGKDHTLLSLLDGEAQVGNVVFLATTNYPTLLPDRIINRPSRFDTVVQVELPDIKGRTEYLKHVLKETKVAAATIKKWAKETDGLSLAHIKEVAISTQVFGLPYEEAMERIQGMQKGKVLERPKKRNAGFGSHD